jgi:UDP-N-acetylmuramoylalanine--D-glutamate ligase
MAMAQHNSHAAIKTIVVGLGVTGLSCVRHLKSIGADVAVADNRELPPGLEELQRLHADTPVFLGPFDRDLLVSADRLVVSPGVPIATPEIAAAADAGVEVVGDVELFARQVGAPVIAITGSNGKSTVTTLVGEMARQSGMRVAVGGNLGKPALDLLGDDIELYVLELSSFQLETTESLRAAVATVLNVSPDHMDRYPSLEDYAAAKAKVFVNAGVGVFNADDPLVAAMGGADDRWSFTLGEAVDDKMFGVTSTEGRVCLARGEAPLLGVDELLMPGRHNRANALAALAIGTASGFELASMLEVLRTFRGLAHRTEFIIEYDGVRWYNDSKGTNVGATVAALQGLQSDGGGLTVLIAGGDCKGADFSPLGAILQGCVRAVVLIGRDADRIAEVVPAAVSVERVETLDDAVAAAARLAQTGDRVLLSPACASFDMFDDYVQRGNHFVQAVQRWAA